MDKDELLYDLVNKITALNLYVISNSERKY